MQKYYSGNSELDLYIQDMIWDKGRFFNLEQLKETEKKILISLCKKDPRFKELKSPTLTEFHLRTIIKVACATVRSDLAANDAYINHSTSGV